MKLLNLMMLTAVALPVAAFGQNTVSHGCSLGGLERRVEIVYEPGRRVPCEVHYYKDTEAPGEKRVLWSAANQAGYCEQKTEEFVAQLRDWGWDCKAAGTGMPAASAEAMSGAVEVDDADAVAVEADDTEDLAPAPEAATEED